MRLLTEFYIDRASKPPMLSVSLMSSNTCQFMPIVGVGKGESHKKGFVMIPEEAASVVTGTTLRTSGTVPENSR